jgi:hypothetical protein
VQPSQPPDDRIIGDGHADGRVMYLTGEDRERHPYQRERGDQPPDPAGLQVIRQRWWLPGGPPAMP